MAQKRGLALLEKALHQTHQSTTAWLGPQAWSSTRVASSDFGKHIVSPFHF
jgi:hypothetical protein